MEIKTHLHKQKYLKICPLNKKGKKKHIFKMHFTLLHFQLLIRVMITCSIQILVFRGIGIKKKKILYQSLIGYIYEIFHRFNLFMHIAQ